MAGVPAIRPGDAAGNSYDNQVTYYASWLAKLSGTYTGSYTQYDGMTWAQLYEAVAAQNTSANPLVLANAVYGEYLAYKLGAGLSAADKVLAGYIQETGPAAAAATQDLQNDIPGASALSGVDAIGQFFNNLGESSTWIRVAKVVIGGILLIIGLAEMTGASKVAEGVAAHVPIPV